MNESFTALGEVNDSFTASARPGVPGWATTRLTAACRASLAAERDARRSRPRAAPSAASQVCWHTERLITGRVVARAEGHLQCITCKEGALQPTAGSATP